MFNQFCDIIPHNAKIMDFGCGTGLPFTKEFIKRGYDVTAIDISDTMTKLTKQNVPTAHVRCISMTDIDYENIFDGVFAGYSMLCLDPENFRIAAEKVAKSLKANGIFMITLNEPSENGHEEHESITQIMDETIYSRPYSEQEIRSVFSDLNLKIISIEHEVAYSEEYGNENTLLILMEKTD